MHNFWFNLPIPPYDCERRHSGGLRKFRQSGTLQRASRSHSIHAGLYLFEYIEKRAPPPESNPRPFGSAAKHRRHLFHQDGLSFASNQLFFFLYTFITQVILSKLYIMWILGKMDNNVLFRLKYLPQEYTKEICRDVQLRLHGGLVGFS